jgi:purine-binding chemotaxis protein CheW
MNDFNPSESYVLFELAGTTCGVRSQSVLSVEMAEHVTAVPNAAPFVEGVTFARGKIIPSINLRVRFGFPRIAADPRARMLVVRQKNRTAGILVDSVREFASIPASTIQPAGSNEPIDRFVEGTATLGKRIIVIVNLEKVIEGV